MIGVNSGTSCKQLLKEIKTLFLGGKEDNSNKKYLEYRKGW